MIFVSFYYSFARSFAFNLYRPTFDSWDKSYLIRWYLFYLLFDLICNYFKRVYVCLLVLCRLAIG